MRDANRWHEYIAYVHEWADCHSDPAFTGMCPPCYEEWLDWWEEGCTYG